MLNEAQFKNLMTKLVRLEETLEPYVFKRIGTVHVRRFETGKQHHQIPEDESVYTETNPGDVWGGEGTYCWFKGKVSIPEEFRGESIYINPVVGGYEAMLWVDGVPYGTFATKIVKTFHGNHYCDLLTRDADPDKELDVAIEFYAGHYIIGCHPFDNYPKSDFRFTYDNIYLCTKNQDIVNFIIDFRALLQLAQKLDPLSFRRAEILNCLLEVHKTVYYAVEDVREEVWREALLTAREIMAPVLESRNAGSAPEAGLVGHSHLDTAWLWPIAETIKKSARTFSNQISLMDQFPEYRFLQSTVYHTEMIRRHYPGLFEKIREKVAEGRYELNGAVWVECDCNIPSGESMIRQFLWGQKHTQQHFGITSNCFWLPDTFGYSAAIPQIMKGCNVDYFLTGKLCWNDTNPFPYEAFCWQGIDGTRVFTHFPAFQCPPEPRVLIEQIEGRGNEENNYIKNKCISSKRLIAYGYGDGGGGPEFEMLEMTRRVRDLEGCPRAEHVNVGRFMEDLRKETVHAPVYKGELYLETHRGTLTNQHTIKRNNRKAEVALHDLEFVTVRQAVAQGIPAEDKHIRPLLETLLVNQFHDILPGSSIAAAHDQSYAEMGEVLQKCDSFLREMVETEKEDNTVTILNTAGFDRNEIIYLEDFCGKIPTDGRLLSQETESIHGRKRLCVANVELLSLGGTQITFQEGSLAEDPSTAAFTYQDRELTTPFATVCFNTDGTIDSFIDTRVGREVKGDGLPLNTFLLAEDVPAGFDNWNIDADCLMKFEPAAVLTDSRIVSRGSIEFRIRNTYRLPEKSSIQQDIVFYSTTPRVDFETIIDWKDKHRFLKVGFDTSIACTAARHEIQFGHCQRPTTRNNTIEQAMFEVVNHKFTDLSETRYGVALLNDCKYGISAEGSDIRLSLHKGGCRPDPRGDEGVHECVYSFLPHVGGFSAEQVIQPAYGLNMKPLIYRGKADCSSLAAVDSSNIIIETVKPCEDNQQAFILRLYEAEGTHTHATLTLGAACRSMELTNMLEETLLPLPDASAADLVFKPFEIKTIQVSYGKDVKGLSCQDR